MDFRLFTDPKELNLRIGCSILEKAQIFKWVRKVINNKLIQINFEIYYFKSIVKRD